MEDAALPLRPKNNPTSSSQVVGGSHFHCVSQCLNFLQKTGKTCCCCNFLVKTFGKSSAHLQQDWERVNIGVFFQQNSRQYYLFSSVCQQRFEPAEEFLFFAAQKSLQTQWRKVRWGRSTRLLLPVLRESILKLSVGTPGMDQCRRGMQ